MGVFICEGAYTASLTCLAALEIFLHVLGYIYHVCVLCMIVGSNGFNNLLFLIMRVKVSAYESFYFTWLTFIVYVPVIAGLYLVLAFVVIERGRVYRRMGFNQVALIVL